MENCATVLCSNYLMNTITQKRSQEKNDAKDDTQASTKVTIAIIISTQFSSSHHATRMQPANDAPLHEKYFCRANPSTRNHAANRFSPGTQNIITKARLRSHSCRVPRRVR